MDQKLTGHAVSSGLFTDSLADAGHAEIPGSRNDLGSVTAMIDAAATRHREPAAINDGAYDYRIQSAVARLTRRRLSQSVNGKDVT